MITYEEAAKRLGIPAEDADGFISFASTFGREKANGGVRADLLQHLTEDFLCGGAYSGSALERNVLEQRLYAGPPLVEAMEIAFRLVQNLPEGEGYGLLLHALRLQVVNGPDEALTQRQLMIVAGVPEEDHSAFREMLYNWRDGEENDRICPMTFGLFLADFPIGQYLGSDLELSVLAQRAQDTRTYEEARTVLRRTAKHVAANAERSGSDLREFLFNLSDSLDLPHFEGKSPAQPLKAVA